MFLYSGVKLGLTPSIIALVKCESEDYRYEIVVTKEFLVFKIDFINSDLICVNVPFRCLFQGNDNIFTHARTQPHTLTHGHRHIHTHGSAHKQTYRHTRTY